MACLCERMYPNYAVFCQQTGLVRATLSSYPISVGVADGEGCEGNFDSQLEKLEEAIPARTISIDGVIRPSMPVALSE
ncbi:DUF416 family protein [Shigella flexneri]